MINATVAHLLQPPRCLRSTSPSDFFFFYLNEPGTRNSHQKACKHTVKDYDNTQPCRTHDGVMPSRLWLPSFSKLSGPLTQTSGLTEHFQSVWFKMEVVLEELKIQNEQPQ